MFLFPMATNGVVRLFRLHQRHGGGARMAIRMVSKWKPSRSCAGNWRAAAMDLLAQQADLGTAARSDLFDKSMSLGLTRGH